MARHGAVHMKEVTVSPVHIHAILCSVVERTLYGVHLIAVASEVCTCVLSS